MILLQLSAGQGPIECCKAVGLALKVIEQQSFELKINLNVLELTNAGEPGCYKSALLALDSTNKEHIKNLALSWQGVMLWICPSQYRAKHKRKNWYFSGKAYEINDGQLDSGVTYQACRASGAGGQHVNTTDSAVRATHTATGLCVRVESERSQHANKRLARALLFQKLETAKLEQMSEDEKKRWQQHWELERGNPVRTFTGDKFIDSK